MRISHNYAIRLENVARRVHSCDRGSLGGYLDADNYESNPFDAALIALAPLWKGCDSHELSDFLYKWERIFRGNEEEPVEVSAFIKELDCLVDRLLAK